MADLCRRGIGFISLHEALDTTAPGDRLIFHVFAALAEFIRELIVEGTNEGLPPPAAPASAGPEQKAINTAEAPAMSTDIATLRLPVASGSPGLRDPASSARFHYTAD